MREAQHPVPEGLTATGLVGRTPGERVMGTETEYGIIAPGSELTPTQLSAAVVTAMGEALEELDSASAAAPWDYLHERPLDDARGFSMRRADAHESQLTHEGTSVAAGASAAGDCAGAGTGAAGARSASGRILMNSVLGNGARFYVDHAHPEYSSPETTNSYDAAVWDQAGDRLASAAARYASERIGHEVILHKNNVDGKGASYGTHENYLTPRALPFDALVAGLLPFFASRHIVCGSGRVGLGQFGEQPGFQISQRADYFEQRVGLETTLRRPLVNTRDEPHAQQHRFRRLHVIVGDANCWGVSTHVRLGATNWVLRLIEAGHAPRIGLADPVAAVKAFSHDPSLRATVSTVDGRSLSGLDIQEMFLEAAERYAGENWAAEEAASDAVSSGAERGALVLWRRIVDTLRADDPVADRLVEWRGKYSLLRAYAARAGLDAADPATWDADQLKLIDLQWSDLRAGKGLAWALERAGKAETVLAGADIQAALTTPPATTRAWARGQAVTTFGSQLTSASWDSLTFDVDGRIERVDMPVPWAATKHEVSTTSLAEFCESIEASEHTNAPTASDPHAL
ncbi:depupylase/deamidase Dop [Pseudoglutamicibacter cumminsii]|uniref:depupylase/deamidase Dop n=1 Tax=Pseudoglutamicibacter cumminsii TaxID=156979 RepID=UPI0019572EB8|nr:depupylase/deamidase Dop [Pseudoglutamicibacter cumminsii]MBM7796739.1 proteasome accessory factor A [Pseudoglutamicibacter cumminsii]